MIELQVEPSLFTSAESRLQTVKAAAWLWLAWVLNGESLLGDWYLINQSSERVRDRAKESVCVCVCVCVFKGSH